MNLQRLTLSILTFLIPAIALSADVKVLSWNVYMLPSPIKKSLQGLRNQEIPAQLVHTDYDIMFFQEAFTGGFRKTMIKKLSYQYPYNFYMKKSNLFQVFGSGVFVMSRYPFKIVDQLRYNSCATEDCFASKGTYVVELTMPSGKQVQFFPTHLQSQENKVAIRKAQLHQIRNFMDKNSKRGVPQVLLGDLNIAGGDSEFDEGQEILDMKATDLIGDLKTTSARVNDCYKTPKNSKWLDHAWIDRKDYSAKSTLKVVPFDFKHDGKNCPLSDHHAVEAHLVFN